MFDWSGFEKIGDTPAAAAAAAVAAVNASAVAAASVAAAVAAAAAAVAAAVAAAAVAAADANLKSIDGKNKSGVGRDFSSFEPVFWVWVLTEPSKVLCLLRCLLRYFKPYLILSHQA